MNKEVVITTDSTCDLPREFLKERNIDIFSLAIHLGSNTFLDGVDVSPDDIYEFVSKSRVLPKTSAVTPIAYAELFEKYTKQGKAVIHISLSSAISSTHHNALIAAMDMDDVYVIDSKNLCTGIGLLVLKACDMRDSGMDAGSISRRLEDLKSHVKVSFVLNTLEYLHKGGRCSGVAKLGANLLNLKPSIVVDTEKGTMSVGKKYRGKIDTVYAQYAKDIMLKADLMDKTRIVIAHSGVEDDKIRIMRSIVEKTAHFDEIIIARAGCTISSHCGPGAMAILYVTQ